MSATASLHAAPEVPRQRFKPTVVPLDYMQPIRFEAIVTENPAVVNFEYNSVDRPMFDDGTHGDLVAGDNTWTILFQPSEILDLLTPDRVFRPFLGYCKPAGGGRYNIFAEVWTPTIGLIPVQSIAPDAQQTDYLANFVATESQLLNFDERFWARRFYATYGDKFDFLNFVLVGGVRGNRTHLVLKNEVLGIGLNAFDISHQFGSGGRLKGRNLFPLNGLFDAADPSFCHETGHQWLNFLRSSPLANSGHHWPKGDIAIHVMGASGSPPSYQGIDFPYTFTSNGQGGYVVGPRNRINDSTYNTMELYLMGLVPPSEVGTFFVLNDQNRVVNVGETLQPSEITLVTVNDVIAAHGPRVPDSTVSQRTFRCATIVLSEELLDVYAMAFYDWFARRAEAKQQVTFASGFSTGVCNPFYVATGGRAVMFSKINDEQPTLAIRRLVNGDIRLNFTAKPGIRYQVQSSSELSDDPVWMDEGPPATVAIDPPGDVEVAVNLTPPGDTPMKFYRLSVIY